MRENTNDGLSAISNLRTFYKKYLSVPSESTPSLTTELLAAVSDNEIESAKVILLYENEGSLFRLNETEADSKMLSLPAEGFPDETVIQQSLEESETEDRERRHCFMIERSGAWFDTANKVKGRVFTALYVGEMEEKQSFFLRCFHEAYSDWIAKTILHIATPVASEKNFPMENGLKEKILKKTVNIVEERLLTLYGIDLSVITEISGSYYEGGKCNAALAFRMGTDAVDGVFFAEDDCVKVTRKNVKRIRKLLEMCRGEHCLLAERQDSNWEVKGLCGSVEEAGSIVFRILDHMCWEMKIGGRPALLYKNGKYLIRQSDKKEREFKATYQKVFGCEPPGAVTAFFNEAKNQPHGTSIIILDKDSAGGEDFVRDEVERLLNQSSGISIQPESEVSREFIIGITSIDGAVILNQKGRVYAIGTILDGNAEIEGDPSHGARHNSVMKYIASKKKEGLKGIGIIFSEDKTIKITSTED